MPDPVRSILLLLFALFFTSSVAQVQIGTMDELIDYSNPREYEVGGITVTGVQFLDESAIITLTGITVGEKIRVPGDEISDAINNLWKQGLLADVKVVAKKIEGNLIFLEFALQERPRLSKFSFNGVSKNEADKLREKLQLVTGKVITENLKQNTINKVREHYIEKGFLFVEVTVATEKDTTVPNSEIMTVSVSNKNRIKVNEIVINGNKEFSDKKIRRKMKGTKQKAIYKVFTSSKFNETGFDTDKEKVIELYRDKGYRDARIVRDTFYRHDHKTVNVELDIEEGQRYYFRNIAWVGNTKYPSAMLTQFLGIKKGDVYSQQKLDEGLFMSQSGRDVSSLYMDDGYLFFQVTPVEVKVDGDSIDFEMRIYEGKQARINKVTVKGNTKTNDKVILREIRTQPGQLFSRADIIRTQRELAQLGYFDQEKLGVNPKPNPENGTVDIEYVVEERPSDQLQLSGGWGAGQVVGTLGVTFNNFSSRNMFRKGAWAPLPSGDGQRLSVQFASTGRQYQSYNLSFTEPWLGGKKPNSLTVSGYRSRQSNGLRNDDPEIRLFVVTGVSVGLGRRLKWPDDYFSLFHELSYQHYDIQNYSSLFPFATGYSNNISFSQTLSRNSVDGFIWIRKGSQLSFTLQLTPPYSLFSNVNYRTADDQERYKLIEYHKWKFSGSWFKEIGSKFVLNYRANFGFLGFYNNDIGQSPFERFYLGGDGLSGFSYDGREVIALRGYQNTTVTPQGPRGYIGGSVYDKFTLELRYPISLNPQATIYALGFLEGGNNWYTFREFDPLNMKRSIGFGARFFLPMFGLLGLDYGYGFDKIQNIQGANGGHFHFTIGQQF
jgi:outer membrane protein insertion porin family